MKVAVLKAPGKLVIEEFPRPTAGPAEVVIEIAVALTDGTDLKTYRRGHPKIPMPTRFGHEFAGVIREIGPGISQWAVGDRVVAVHSAPCLQCYWCEVGQHELCATLLDRLLLGAYGEFVVVPPEIVAQNMYALPPSLSFEAAAFLEPLACVVHAWEGLAAGPATSVVIHGLGGFGLLHAMVARAYGVRELYLVGRSARAIQRAKSLALGTVLDATQSDPSKVIFAQTAGRGSDIVIECTGAKEVWESAPRLARRGGAVILFGGLAAGTSVHFDAQRLHYDEVQLRSPFHLTPRSVRQAFEFLQSGMIDPRGLITASFPLSEIQAAFAKLDSGTELKIAIRTGEAA